MRFAHDKKTIMPQSSSSQSSSTPTPPSNPLFEKLCRFDPQDYFKSVQTSSRKDVKNIKANTSRLTRSSASSVSRSIGTPTKERVGGWTNDERSKLVSHILSEFDNAPTKKWQVLARKLPHRKESEIKQQYKRQVRKELMQVFGGDAHCGSGGALTSSHGKACGSSGKSNGSGSHRVYDQGEDN